MPLDKKNLLSNMSVAFLAQGVSLALSFLTALIVPKLLGVTEFGYWQLFLFYSAYVGFFHFGLNDGVYLINGGESRRSIDSPSIVAQFKFGLCFQMLFALGIGLFAVFSGVEREREFVLIVTAVYLVVHNAAGFLGYLFQALNETKLYSFSSIVNRIAFLFPLVALLLSHHGNFELYVISYAASEVCSLAFCCWKGRDILFGGSASFIQGMHDSFSSIKVGVKLMIANVASSLILGFVRFAVDANWGIDAFGTLSFSLSLVHFFLVFVSQASMVLFPALRNISRDEVHRAFDKARQILGFFLPAVYIFYFPARWALGIWLPQYEASLIMFAIYLPLCLFDGKMNLVGTTFLKVVRKEGLLLRINLISMVGSFAFVAATVLLGGSITIMSLCVVAVIASRSIVTEQIIAKAFGLPREIGLSAAEVLLSGFFIMLAFTTSDLMGAVAYLAAYAAFCVIYRKRLAILLPKKNSRK